MFSLSIGDVESDTNAVAMESHVETIQQNAVETRETYSLAQMRTRIRRYIICFGAFSVVCTLGMVAYVIYLAIHIANIRNDMLTLNSFGFAIMITLNVSSLFAALRKFDSAAAVVGFTDGFVSAIMCLVLITCNMVYKNEYTTNEEIKPILYEFLHVNVVLCALCLVFKIYQSVAVVIFSEYKNRKRGDSPPGQENVLTVATATTTMPHEDDEQEAN